MSIDCPWSIYSTLLALTFYIPFKTKHSLLSAGNRSVALFTVSSWLTLKVPYYTLGGSLTSQGHIIVWQLWECLAKYGTFKIFPDVVQKKMRFCIVDTPMIKSLLKASQPLILICVVWHLTPQEVHPGMRAECVRSKLHAGRFEADGEATCVVGAAVPQH